MMRFAFSTVACPTWDFGTVARRAREYGYDGVELRGAPNETVLSAANPFLSDSEKVREIFARERIAIACLASPIAMTQTRRRDASLAGELRAYIDLAARLGCGLVKVLDAEAKPGRSRAWAGLRLGDWLLPLGDYAADRGVAIVVENALSFRASKEMWTILDRLAHPSIACCWDVFNAALIGESPHVSVPTLNSKIQYVQLKDAKLGPLGAAYCKLGEGDVKVRPFLERLMGIGYQGWVTFEWEKAWLPNIAEPQEILPDSIAKLREWTRDPSTPDAEGDAEPAAASHGPAIV